MGTGVAAHRQNALTEGGRGLDLVGKQELDNRYPDDNESRFSTSARRGA
jgi:hypothetical protein